jgi:hypothetical protein
VYSTLPSFVLGFHGCDRDVAERVLAGSSRLRPSVNEYDWLGHAIYFWEYSPQRALEYARTLKSSPKRSKSAVTNPFALGAVIDLGHCLKLLNENDLHILKQSYRLLAQTSERSGTPLPVNRTVGGGADLLLRNLDCAVIEALHGYNEQEDEQPYDSVRGVFFEGNDLYPGAGFRKKNHIQVCVRNPNCIKGYFRPLEPVKGFGLP